LRQDADFREVAKYPSFVNAGMLQPGITPFSAPQMPPPGAGYISGPNQLIFGGQQYGQATFMGDAMPTGIAFEGVRFFESNNMPTATVNLTYTTSTNATLHPTGAANRTGNLGIFFGQQAIGEGIATEMPISIRLNNNDDFQRFVIAIWAMYGGWALSNERFVTVARTYGD
jgi:hypothetical protein